MVLAFNSGNCRTSFTIVELAIRSLLIFLQSLLEVYLLRNQYILRLKQKNLFEFKTNKKKPESFVKFRSV